MPIAFQHVGFEWPNGKSLLFDLTFTLNKRRYGLVGSNGVGKSTLARLIIGDLEPTSGRMIVDGSVTYFAQFERPPAVTVEDYLSASIAGFQRWLFEFVEPVARESSCESLSGGEWCRVRLAKAAATEPELLILDEPTNHLDREGREALNEFVARYDGGLLVISHDRELLSCVDEILELTPSALASYGGDWAIYQAARDEERARLSRELELAKSQRNQARRERVKKQEAQQKRQRQGAKEAARGGMPKILLGARKRRAEETAGRIDAETQERAEAAVTEAWRAFEALKFDPLMYARVPQVEIPAQQLIAEASGFNVRFEGSQDWLWKNDLHFAWRGPQRIVIHGGNGTGKSTLLKRICGRSRIHEERGSIRAGAGRIAYLDQSYALPSEEGTVLECARDLLELDESELRGGLATFLFQGEAVHKKVARLSGGEKLRLSLAMLLLAPNAPQVLVLDEPTNNLDLANLEFLEELLNAFGGAIIVASHDRSFLERLRLTEELVLER